MLFALAIMVLVCGVAVAAALFSVRRFRGLGVVVGIGALIVTSPVLLLLLGWVLYWLFGDTSWWPK